MAKKRSASSVRESRVGKKEKYIYPPDSEIDFSDIPELTDEQLAEMRPVGRPVTGRAKQLISIRVSPDVIRKLKKLAAKAGKPYQTLINELLIKATKGVA